MFRVKKVIQRLLAFLFFSDWLVFNRPFRHYLNGLLTLPDNKWIVKFVEQYHYLWRFIQVEAKAKNIKHYSLISQQEWESCWATLYNYYYGVPDLRREAGPPVHSRFHRRGYRR